MNIKIENIILTGSWTTAFYLKDENQIKRSKLLATLPQLKREWRVSFEFKAESYDYLQQLLHLTTGGRGIGSGSKYGDRTPAIWIFSTKGFLICSAVNGKYSFCATPTKYFKPLPAAGEWAKIQVGQEKVGSKMIYSISIDGTQRFSVENTHPAELENVKVFASSPWYSPGNGFIKNLRIENNLDGKCWQRLISKFTICNNHICYLS